ADAITLDLGAYDARADDGNAAPGVASDAVTYVGQLVSVTAHDVPYREEEPVRVYIGDGDTDAVAQQMAIGVCANVVALDDVAVCIAPVGLDFNTRICVGGDDVACVVLGPTDHVTASVLDEHTVVAERRRLDKAIGNAYEPNHVDTDVVSLHLVV